MDELDQYEISLLSDFISEHWSRFLAFCEEREIDEPQAEELSNKIDKAAGRT